MVKITIKLVITTAVNTDIILMIYHYLIYIIALRMIQLFLDESADAPAILTSSESSSEASTACKSSQSFTFETGASDIRFSEMEKKHIMLNDADVCPVMTSSPKKPLQCALTSQSSTASEASA